MRYAVVVVLVLSGCVRNMARAPSTIPYDGHVECDDSLDTPIASALAGGAALGVSALAASNPKFVIENGGILWLPVVGTLAFDMLVAGAMGVSYASDCRDAKQRAAAMLAERKTKSDARAKAGELWKRAAAAARAEDCATVRELDPQIERLDVELHALVFSRDVAIARCLAVTDSAARAH